MTPLPPNPNKLHETRNSPCSKTHTSGHNDIRTGGWGGTYRLPPRPQCCLTTATATRRSAVRYEHTCCTAVSGQRSGPRTPAARLLEFRCSQAVDRGRGRTELSTWRQQAGLETKTFGNTTVGTFSDGGVVNQQQTLARHQLPKATSVTHPKTDYQ
jgi:hypothetical protein